MEATLPVLDRVVARYRRDVHTLADGASPEALQALEAHLGRRLPPDLRAFLAKHNGAALFRGALVLRSTSELAPAAATTSAVISFADGQNGVRWAWAMRGDRAVYGTFGADGLEPVYGSFVAWLEGEIGLLEARLVDPDESDALRMDLVPTDPVVAVRRARVLVRDGRPDDAAALLEDVVRRDPSDLAAWQLLGDALSVRDRVAAQQAWLMGFRKTTFPLPWPGAPCLSAELVVALSHSHQDEESWDRELERFLGEQVTDVTDARSHEVVVAAGLARARTLCRRGHRRSARDVLSTLLQRAHAWTFKSVPWDAVLELAQLEVGLGHHDDAEQLVRRVGKQAPPEARAASLLVLAEIAVMRQEPWAEDILDDAAAGPLDEPHRLQLSLLRVERAIRQQRVPDAVKAVEGIEKLARRVGLPRLEALATVARADVVRLQGRPHDALDLYRQALTGIGERDPEVRARILLRLADLAFDQQDPADGRDLSMQAAALFRSIELPVREAWAWLRVARGWSDRDPQRVRALCAAARERFVAADLAAGVAAVDSLLGDPGLSLAWHLERSSAQARARHDAQRGRPPYEPLDADRPERRLGAHRLAIAACDNAVVTALAREMDATARAVLVGRGRPTDPPVLRYLAAVDLVSGHPSYEAARVLLDHLLQHELDPVLSRGLQGAIARSPNAALVDGLLRCVERPSEHPPTAVAAAAELLGLRREPVALAPLLKLLTGPTSHVIRKAALGALGRIGNRSVVDQLLPALDDGRLAEAAALALLMLGDRRGVDFHGRALVERRGELAGSPGEIVGRYGGPDHLLLLIRGAEGDSERALGALQGLGLLGDVRGAATLLQALHHRERQVVEVASGALTILTGRMDDPTEPGVRARWHDWWELHQKDFAQGVRYRFGKPFDLQLLLDTMDDPDPYQRRTSYDELVITSGQSLPFDADGPVRVQLAHKRAWRRWFQVARGRFAAGRWVLDGRVIG
jgi:HEAT repeat protein/thioredoxin-like negative regulator of GroEL